MLGVDPGLLALAGGAWLGLPCERSSGFLWVFFPSATCFRPVGRDASFEDHVDRVFLLFSPAKVDLPGLMRRH